MNKETAAAITAAVMVEVEKLKDYQLELVDVAYDDKLTDEQVDALVREDFEDFDGGHFDEWSSELRYESTKYLIDEILDGLRADWDDEALEDWKFTDAYDEVRFDIEERDTSNPLKDLAHQTGQVMLRIASPITEDDSLSYQEVDERHMLDLLGLPITDRNLEVSADIIANASTEYSVCMGYWLASVDVGDLYDLLTTTQAERFEITDPAFWLGNPFAGSGWADQFEGTITVAREDLRTDKAAFGYGWQEVCGGSANEFPVKIKEAP